MNNCPMLCDCEKCEEARQKRDFPEIKQVEKPKVIKREIPINGRCQICGDPKSDEKFCRNCGKNIVPDQAKLHDVIIK